MNSAQRLVLGIAGFVTMTVGLVGTLLIDLEEIFFHDIFIIIEETLAGLFPALAIFGAVLLVGAVFSGESKKVRTGI